MSVYNQVSQCGILNCGRKEETRLSYLALFLSLGDTDNNLYYDQRDLTILNFSLEKITLYQKMFIYVTSGMFGEIS